MDEAPVSPWSGGVEMVSPDGALAARIVDAAEASPSRPGDGLLEMSNGPTLEHANPSIVWSDDSRFLAVPQWIGEDRQRLVILRAADGAFEPLPMSFNVLELHAFEDGVVSGRVSPVHRPFGFHFDVAALLQEARPGAPMQGLPGAEEADGEWTPPPLRLGPEPPAG